MENPSQSYEASPAIWDQRIKVLPAIRHRWTHPTLPPAKQARPPVFDLLTGRDGRLSWPWCWLYYLD